jgi:predicted ribosome quality control (RQC) complex YloA/Tae2 family protein
MRARIISLLFITKISSNLCFTFEPSLLRVKDSHAGRNDSRVILHGVLSRSAILKSAYGKSSKSANTQSRRLQQSQKQPVQLTKSFLLDVINEAIYRQDLALESVARELQRKENMIIEEAILNNGIEKVDEAGVSSLFGNKMEKRREDLTKLICELSALKKQINDTKCSQEFLEKKKDKIEQLGFSAIFEKSKSSWKTQQLMDHQFGRPIGFDGQIFYSPLGVPILVGKMKAHKDDVMRNAAQGGDLWFQVEDYNGSRVLLRTSLMKGTKGSKRCIQMAADLAAKFSVWGDDYESIPVMYTDSRKVAKRGSKVGRMKQKKSLGRLFGTPKNVERPTGTT